MKIKPITTTTTAVHKGHYNNRRPASQRPASVSRHQLDKMLIDTKYLAAPNEVKFCNLRLRLNAQISGTDPKLGICARSQASCWLLA